MSRQNRVTPCGDLIVTPARGTLMGNRGCLHDARGQIRRHHVGRRWIICLLEFKGRHRTVMTPGRYTELFFLDEATALAAGHRPCAECQRARFDLFRTYWATANPGSFVGDLPTAEEIDKALHRERVANGRKQTHHLPLDSVPPGAFILQETAPCLVTEQGLLTWTAEGYTPKPSVTETEIEVLTPPSVVRMLTQGYPFEVHFSAAMRG